MPVFHSNALSDREMLEILKSQNIEKNGIYMKDELPTKLRRGCYIVNLQSSSQGHGTHWVAFYYTPTFSYYYDSYGFIAPLEIQNKIKPYAYNDKEIQDINSTACGYYCLAFVLVLLKNNHLERAYQSFVNLFSKDTEKNDRILYNILYE